MDRAFAISDDAVSSYRLRWWARLARAIRRLRPSRRDRQVLQRLSDHELRDIGLCRDDSNRVFPAP